MTTAVLATWASLGLADLVVAAEPEPTRLRAEWEAPAITVAEYSGVWTIAGTHRRVELRASDLALRVFTGGAEWSMVPSNARDMRVRHGGVGAPEFFVRLADAATKRIEPYDTGFSVGVKLTLSGWQHDGAPLPLELFLTIALEGRDEELVCTVAADESRGTIVRQLDWPTALEASTVDHTLLPNARGNLLPRDWPKEFHPIRRISEIGQAPSTDTSDVQSNIIECWSMAWWGFQKGEAVMMVIVETPDDAAYQFEHPAGGPTVIGPRWRAQLGRLGYPRSVRMCFVDRGNYVQLAQRYRRHVINRGLFVSLREKIARSPAVASLIGTPLTRIGILRNFLGRASG